MVQQIYAYLTFVTVDQMRNAMVELIHARKDIVDVVRMMNVRFQRLVGLENAKVSNFKYSKAQMIYYLLDNYFRIYGHYLHLMFNLRYVNIN